MHRSFFPFAVLLPLTIHAQVAETVSLGPGYTEQVWYSLQNGVQQTRPAAEWDLAFEITGFTASILANTQKAGLVVYRAPFSAAQWNSLDTAGIASWPVLHNADTSWSRGAFNQTNTADEFDLGWGVYNPITHVVTGDSLHVMRLADGSWKKLRFDALATSTYSFTYANLDGSAEQTALINKADYTGKNFAYWSLETNAAIDREPPSADWDLTFCKYITFIPQPYAVTGVLHNKAATSGRIAGVPPAGAVWTDATFSPHINTIGYDWKTFDMGTMLYVMDDSLTFFVHDMAGNIWKVYFTAFEGSATGNIGFTRELVSATALHEMTASSVHLVPNPAAEGTIQLIANGLPGRTEISIIDQQGRVMLQRAGTWAGRSYPVDVGMLAPGCYLVRVAGNGESRTARLVIE